jgi:hypothetical protein
MAGSTVARLQGVPERVGIVLSDFIAALQDCCSSDLVSVVLFGSGAEGKLTAVSDVNLLVVLRTFDGDRMARIRDAYLAANAAIKLQAMFLLEDELPSAAELFAQKFADILRRHRNLFGKDVLSTVTVPRGPEIFRLRQILLNLTLRLREAYISRGERPEQVVRMLADMLGPLRAAAATLLELEGAPNPDSSAALMAVAAACGARSENAATQLLAAHRGELPGDGGAVALQVIECLACMSQRAARLS